MIGMSGGLDSSVAAALLKKQGYDCVGVYLNLWADPTDFSSEESKKFPQNKCCSIASLMTARSICQKLEIPFYSINLEGEFREKVVESFLDGFRKGETPNPCVTCNKTIKFGAFFMKMKELGCDYLATGHYVKIEKNKEGKFVLHRSNDMSKDQSYFLYNLTQEKLSQLLFPLGGFTKPEVREIAKTFDLKELKGKPESQGVCFYPEATYKPFLQRYLKKDEDFKPGEILNDKGEKVGEHDGLPFYTIGQRKGIKIGGGPALFVSKMDTLKNALIVGNEEDILAKEVSVRDMNFLTGEEPTDDLFEVRIRNHGLLAKGRLKKSGKKYSVEFEIPQRAVMPGQSLVLYRGTELVGGGILL
jgi:tRNA-specific 2-thiouridylase